MYTVLSAVMKQEQDRTDRDLKSHAYALPDTPGVYIMRDAHEDVIYVGKAKSLRKRVPSYFGAGKDRKTQVLMRHVRSLEHITTQNEYEALLLENTLIKNHHPKYNIRLMDGKTYPVIRVTNEPFPRVFRTRRIVQDGSSYYGPFPNVQSIDRYLELIERLFPLRKCRGPLKKREHPCLYYHIGRCAAPCCGRISPEEYHRHVEKVKQLLSGQTDELVAELRTRMQEHGERLEFEKAAELRDTIQAIEELSADQQVVDMNPEDRDYVGFAAQDQLCSFVVFQMRDGKLLGRDFFRTEFYGSEDEALSLFLVQYYSTMHRPASKLYVPRPVEEDLIRSFFRRECHAEVQIHVPGEGRHARLLRLVEENARQDLERRLRDADTVSALSALKEALGLPRLPKRIEGFDIAQLSGKHPVASMVSFWKGRPDKSQYRRFHMKSLRGAIDDYEAIREVVARRYTRVVNENLDKPDLILIDGGKGQVSSAKSILVALGLDSVPVAGLAKQHEEIFVPGRAEAFRLPEGSDALRILQAVRDEAHRFATTFNKSLRKRTVSLSTLERVPGIGEVRARKLLQTFGSMEAIGRQRVEDVASAIGVRTDLAQQVLESVTRNRPGEGEERQQAL
jgi:excinuclease ABC subunit C